MLLLLHTIYCKMFLLVLWITAAAAGSVRDNVSDPFYDGMLSDCNYNSLFTPSSYDITIDLHYEPRTFSGHVIITGEVSKRTTEIKLDSGVTVTSAELLLPEGRRSLTWSDEDMVLTLEFNRDLIPGNEYRVLIEFSGNIREHRGIYGANYTSPDNIERYFIASEFQASFAHYAFPCVDRPSAKAYFRLNVSREAEHVAISNTALVHSRPSRDGKMWDSFEETPKMSPYLLAFVVGDFVGVEGKRNNTAWMPRGWPKEQASFALNLIPKFQTILEKLTGIPYDLPKLDHVALPSLNSVAMENWGMITYKESILLKASEGSMSDKLTLIFTLAHELAHQWFGNLVTCKSWGYTWLNEGITSFLQYKVAEQEFPEWDAMGFLISEELRSIMEDDGYSPMPLTNESCQLVESNSFSLLSYYKGAAIIRMAEHILSTEELLQGLHNFLKFYAFGAVNEEKLWEQFETFARRKNALPKNENFTTLMKTWTNNDGLPLLLVHREGHTVRLSQVPVDFFGLREEQSASQSWWIPLTYTLSSEMNFNDTSLKAWARPNEELVLDLHMEEDDYAIFNIQQVGYYRVNYDEETWYKISKQLRHDHTVFHTINRALLLDDVFTLAMMKRVNYSVALTIATYLQDELEYEPWGAAILKLSTLRIPLYQSSVLKLFDKFILRLLEKIYTRIPENPEQYEMEMNDPRERLLATKISQLACDLKLKSCERRASLIAKMLLNGEENYKMVQDSKIPLMCTMVRLGGEEIWNYAWELFKYEKATKVKGTLLRALSCTQDKALFKKIVYMEYGNTPDSKYLNGYELINHIDDQNNYCSVVEVIAEIAETNKTWLSDLEDPIQSLSSITFPKVCQDQLAAVVDANADVLSAPQIIVTMLSESAPYKWKEEALVEKWLLAELEQVNSVIETGSLYQDYYQRPEIEFPIQDYDGEKARAEAKTNYENQKPSSASSASLAIWLLAISFLLLT